MNLPLLPVDAPLVLFLIQDSATGQYTIVDEIAGAFSETTEGISPLPVLRDRKLRPAMDFEQVSGMSVPAFVQLVSEIRDAAESTKKWPAGTGPDGMPWRPRLATPRRSSL